MFQHALRTLILLLIFSVVATGTIQARGDDKEFVVVIDPGHGGKDAGALGQKTNEKSINLDVALKLAKLLRNTKGVRVEMTRDKDYFVTLQGRADFANQKNADIFVSIHANSLDAKNPNRTRINGAAVYTLGLKKSDTNLSVAMRENSVMKLEPDYTTTYQGFDPSSAESYIAFEMMQHKNMDQSIELAQDIQNQLVNTAGRKNNGVRQAPFWVLVSTGMPAVLVELDFISNPRQEKYMMSEEGSTALARAIYNGIERYRSDSSKTRTSTGGSKADRPTPSVATPSEPAAETASGADNDAIVYKIQFLTSPSKLADKDKKLQGLSPVSYYEDGGMYKYTYGEYKSSADAASDLKKVRAKFSDAFVIRTRGGKRIK